VKTFLARSYKQKDHKQNVTWLSCLLTLVCEKPSPKRMISAIKPESGTIIEIGRNMLFKLSGSSVLPAYPDVKQWTYIIQEYTIISHTQIYTHRYTHRHRHTYRHRHRERHTQIHTQTHIQTQTQGETHTETHTDKDIQIKTHRHRYRYTRTRTHRPSTGYR